MAVGTTSVYPAINSEGVATYRYGSTNTFPNAGSLVSTSQVTEEGGGGEAGAVVTPTLALMGVGS